MQLFIDLGHSAKYQGANGVRNEVKHVRDVWSHLKAMIHPFFDVILVPDSYPTDKGASTNLLSRVRFINGKSKEPSFLISLHGNASGAKARGIETVYMGGSNEAKALASELSKAVSIATGSPMRRGDGSLDDRKTPHGRIAMVRDTKPFALLIELGFVTSVQDMDIPAEKYAEGIAKFLLSLASKELAKAWEGKNVQGKGTPEIWRIENGKKRHFPNEGVFFSHGGKFGMLRNYDEVPSEVLAIIPRAENMGFNGTR